ncbi:MAG: BON domain-containing protein [Planctomycetes bacterium]|nr:BON domain-containing protein [Planctomycetota bacterium]
MSKKYIRHDAHESHDLYDRIHLVLSQESHLLGRAIQVEVVDRDVLLSGTVRSYFQKQMAQESLRKVNGLGRIHNNLSVTKLTPCESTFE